jgi:hypothetical protein
MAALRLPGLDTPWGVDGASKGAMFHGWVREGWGPTWPPGASVLWAKLAAHKVAGVEARLATRGARLLRLSLSVPAFTPLEPCWSQSKTCWRRAKARTVAVLSAALKEALDTVTQADLRSWFGPGGSSRQ